jgi:lysophospholipase L1-like esterase
MPRKEEGEAVYWEETWPYILKNMLAKDFTSIEMVNAGKRARNSSQIKAQEFTEAIVLFEPDVCIVQVGIVDSMPRVFSRSQKRIIGSTLFPSRFRNYLIDKRSRNRPKYIGKDPLRKVEVSPIEFRQNTVNFINCCRDQQKVPFLIFIPILLAAEIMDQKSPGASNNAKIYNDHLQSVCIEKGVNLIEAKRFYSNDEPTKLFLNDGYHLSKFGNQRLGSLLQQEVKSLYPDFL